MLINWILGHKPQQFCHGSEGGCGCLYQCCGLDELFWAHGFIFLIGVYCELFLSWNCNCTVLSYGLKNLSFN